MLLTRQSLDHSPIRVTDVHSSKVSPRSRRGTKESDIFCLRRLLKPSGQFGFKATANEQSVPEFTIMARAIASACATIPS